MPWLSDWPLRLPRDWLEYVNGVESEGEVAALRQAVVRGAPYGDEPGRQQTAEALRLQSALRRPARPRKTEPRAPENLT